MHAFKRNAALAIAVAAALAGCKGKTGAAGANGTDGRDAPIPPGAGFQLAIQSVTIPASGAPTVTYQALDGAGNPLDVKAETLASMFGSRGIRFTFAQRQADGTLRSLYESGTPAAAQYAPRGSSSFSLAQVADMHALVSDGVYTFTVPTGNYAQAFTPDRTAVWTIAAFAARLVDGVEYPADASYNFTPSTGTVAAARTVVTDAACNACHKHMTAHGSRRGVTTCLTCHYPGWTDTATGENIDFRQMIHRIHNATYLLGTFSNVVFPDLANGVKNCAMCHGAAAPTPSIVACKSCHTALSLTHGGGAACSSCHDNSVAPTVARAHSAQYDAGATKLLLAGRTIDITIDAVNAVNGASDQPTVDFTIRIDGVPATTLTRSTFCMLPAELTLAATMTQACGSLRFSIGGPTSDFGSGVLNGAGSGFGYLQSPNFIESDSNFGLITAIDAPAGKYRAPLVTGTSLTKFRAVAAGTSIGVGSELYALEAKAVATNDCGSGSIASPPSEGAACAVREWPQSPTAMFFVQVGGTTAGTARRTITDNAKCNACHNELGFHGGEARRTPQYCAICHHKNNVNDERTTRLEFTLNASGLPTTTPYSSTPNSVDIMAMAHKIHAGGALANSYVLGTDRSLSAAAPIADTATFAGAFPGDLGDCQTCHAAGTYGLPKATNLPLLQLTYTCTERAGDADNFCDSLVRWPDATTGIGDEYSVTNVVEIPPQQAACTSCHDSDAAKGHAELNTTPGGVETCAVCHGEDATWDALQVHQPAP